MPKSKRNRLVSLTATRKNKSEKNSKESKSRLVEDVRDCCDRFKRVFLIRIGKMRNAQLKELRTHLNEMFNCKFFFGHNKVIRIALGVNEKDEFKTNLHLLAKCVYDQCGLLFTNSDKEQILDYLNKFSHNGFARTGDIATQTIDLEEGPLKQIPHNLEPTLRQLGMPSTLKKGVVTLTKEFQVCSQGQELTSEQARILKLLDIEMAEFRVKVEAIWSKDGNFEKLNIVDDDNNEDVEFDEDNEK